MHGLKVAEYIAKTDYLQVMLLFINCSIIYLYFDL